MTSGTSRLRWVRPLRRILCVFDGEVVPFAIDGIESGDVTEGHRFMGSKRPFHARTFDQYVKALADNAVLLDAASGASASPTARAPSASRGTWSWWRTRACWTRSRASPNGPPRSWARWTPSSSTFRPR